MHGKGKAEKLWHHMCMERNIAALMKFVTVLLSKTACSTIRSISICMHNHIIRTLFVKALVKL